MILAAIAFMVEMDEVDIAKISTEMIVSIRGLDMNVSTGGSMNEIALDRCPNLLSEVKKLPLIYGLKTSILNAKGYQDQLMRVKISLKDGRTIIVDQNGFLCFRSKNKKTSRCYELARGQYMSFSLNWHDAILKNMGLLRKQNSESDKD